jgi:hypothetical protein
MHAPLPRRLQYTNKTGGSSSSGKNKSIHTNDPDNVDLNKDGTDNDDTANGNGDGDDETGSNKTNTNRDAQTLEATGDVVSSGDDNANADNNNPKADTNNGTNILKVADYVINSVSRLDQQTSGVMVRLFSTFFHPILGCSPQGEEQIRSKGWGRRWRNEGMQNLREGRQKGRQNTDAYNIER